MGDPITGRINWEEIEKEELRILRQMSVQDSLMQYLRLQTEFEWQLQQTQNLFVAERREAIAELQARLRHLA